jgi:hypothetical protein
MTLVTTPLTLILFFSLMAQQDEKIFTCKVTGPTTVECPIRNPIPECQNSKHEYCRSVTIAKINWDNEVFSEWLLQADHWNFPLRKVRPRVGQKLKVVEGDGGQFFPVASCEVRIHRRVNAWAAAHPGELPTFTTMEPPKDCQPT